MTIMENYNINLTNSLKIIVDFLDKNRIDYMLFGGIALGFYGTPRQTFDIDLKINISNNFSQEEFISKLKDISSIIPQNANDFINSTSVLPIEINGVKIDLVFASLPIEIDAINKAQLKPFSNISVRVISVEDLILHKIISTSKKDWVDIEDLVDKNTYQLDWGYILKHAKELSLWLDKSDLYENLLRLKNG